MQSLRRRKCYYCGELFRPDPRNRTRQKYCSKPDCRKASKKASQKKWLAKPENRNYFRNPENTRRVQEWRASNPDYWRKKILGKNALQDRRPDKLTEEHGDSDKFARNTLQDLSFDYRPVLLGFMAHLSGSVLQDEIAVFGRRLQQLGLDILSESTPYKGGRYDSQQAANLAPPDPPGS